MQLTHIRYLDVAAPLASGHEFLSAASGLVHIGDRLCVVGDDEQHLAVFNRNDDTPGTLIRLLPGDLPRKRKKRKKVKPDFEILLTLPTLDDAKWPLLCAMGSGSTDQRMRAALVNIATGSVAVHDLSPLFAALSPLVTEINLEGAVLRSDRVLLFNRGNMQNPETHILEAGLSTITGGEDAQVAFVKTLCLPMVGEVPLTVTDACSVGDSYILLSAVAEVTDDSYADGDIVGAAIILLDTNLDVVKIEPLEPICKIEGISAQRTEAGADLLCVSDADDPDMPSSLFSARLKF